MTEPVLNVTTTDIGPDGAVLIAAGDIDFGSHHVLRTAAASAFERNRIRLVVDVGRVRICDSSGLSLFVDLHRQTTASGGWLRLACPGPLLVKTLAVTNLDRVLPAFDSVDAALAA